MRIRLLATFALVNLTLTCAAQASLGGPMPPKTWVDKDTGHRVWRLSNEPNSGGFYFNVNAYTPDGRQMIYTAPDGIHVMEMATRRTKLLVANPPRPADERGAMYAGMVHALVVGHKTNSVFFTKSDAATGVTSVYKADTNSGVVRKLVDLPAKRMIVSVNADETLAAGTYIEGDATGKEYGQNMPARAAARTDNRVASETQGPHYQPMDKGEMMERRLAARLPLVLFTIRLEPGPNGEKPGDMKILLHSTDWVNHLLFSPTDPTLLMYCHEGPWQKVDRIWMIHTDGTHNTLIHKRTMFMEIAGHEFWGLDGETIWYDWQYPKGEDFFLAGYNLETGKRTAYHLQRNEWGIHFNVTRDQSLFCDDGGDPGQVARAKDGEWIELIASGDDYRRAGRAERADILAAGCVSLRASGEHGSPLLSRGAECALFAGQEAGDFYEQHVWAELRVWRGGREGRESAGGGCAVDARSGAEVQSGRSAEQQDGDAEDTVKGSFLFTPRRVSPRRECSLG